MTGSTIWKFSRNTRWMRFAMTILTLGNHLMILFMAGYTADIVMFCGGGHELIKCHIMTGGTLFGRQVIAVADRQWFMGLMAVGAIGLNHFR